MPRGRIKNYRADGGYGFIEPADGGSDLFFHKSEFQGEGHAIERGMEVEYEVGRGRNGRPAAKNVRPTGSAPSARRSRSGSGRFRPPSRSSNAQTSPLPNCVRRYVAEVVEPREQHPGLRLDKLATTVCGKQEQQFEHLEAVVRCGSEFAEPFRAEWRRRRTALLDAVGACSFSLRLEGRMTLHLARAGALENAGICLHRIYGFPYLPGSGLKGMASAYAELCWLPEQPDHDEAAKKIAAVFGWGPAATGDRERGSKQHQDPRDGKTSPMCAGEIVFHDAWPSAWPVLSVDITNNHHSDYYQGAARVAGDWDSPTPIYFLTVPAGTEFEFAVSKRRAKTPDELLQLAQSWLRGALCELGAGAKTASGYGYFTDVRNEGGDVGTRPTLERLDGRAWKSGVAAKRALTSRPKAGDRVTVTLLEEKTRKGKWKAAYGEHTGVVNVASGASVPEEWAAGKQIEVSVQNDQPQFLWPPREPKTKKAPGSRRR